MQRMMEASLTAAACSLQVFRSEMNFWYLLLPGNNLILAHGHQLSPSLAVSSFICIQTNGGLVDVPTNFLTYRRCATADVNASTCWKGI